MNNLDALHARAKALGLHGLLAHWHDATAAGWLHTLIEWEEQERARRSLERRLKDAHIGRFKPLCDFDWAWPKQCDKPAIEALMSLEFLNDRTDGRTIFLESLRNTGEEELLDLKNRQFVITKVIARTFKDLDLSDDIVTRWRPYRGKQSIVIDPQRAFGQPIAARYGVPTVTLADAVKAEPSIERVSYLYDVPVPVVTDAVNYEKSLLAA
jgi:uncharacterized protein (DUF433 family)